MSKLDFVRLGMYRSDKSVFENPQLLPRFAICKWKVIFLTYSFMGVEQIVYNDKTKARKRKI